MIVYTCCNKHALHFLFWFVDNPIEIQYMPHTDLKSHMVQAPWKPWIKRKSNMNEFLITYM